MKRIIYGIVLFMLIVIPTQLFAKEDSLLYEKLFHILGDDGKLNITSFKTLSPSELDNKPNPEEEEASADMGFSRVISSYIYEIDEVKQLLKEYEEEHPRIDVYCLSTTNCGVNINYDTDMRGDPSDAAEQLDGDYEYPSPFYKHYDVSIDVLESRDNDKYNLSKQLFGEGVYSGNEGDNNIEFKKFNLYDLAYINQLYNHNNGADSFIDNLYANPLLIYKSFPELNDLLYMNENFSIKYAMYSNKGTETNKVENFIPVDFTSFYKDTAYMVHTFEFYIAPVLFVDETSEDLIEAAKARIENYIGNKDVKVVIDDITPTFEPEVITETINDLNKFLTRISQPTVLENDTRIYSLKIGASESPNNFFIIKTNKSNIKDLEIKGLEKKNGIRFSTTDSIPIDSSLTSEDVTSAFLKLNKNILSAFNLNLFSALNNVSITKVENGLNIMIPVSDDFSLKGKKISYLNDKGKAEEDFDAEIETVDGKKYISFITKHLSVYGIVNDKSGNGKIVNPKTGVTSASIGIMVTLLISLIGFIGLNKMKNPTNI